MDQLKAISSFTNFTIFTLQRLTTSPNILNTVAMLDQFSLWHLPPLFVATTTTFGGFWPFFDAPGAMLEFGFPIRIASNQNTHPVMMTSSARTTVLGALIFLFYFQSKIVEMDAVIALFGTYVGLADWYALRGEANGKAVFRLVSGLLIGAWGFFGMSSTQ